MYFDFPPSQRQREMQQRQLSPRSTSPVTTATTTLLPFRRSGRGISAAAALSPLQEYVQPQWAAQQAAQHWAPPGAAVAATRRVDFSQQPTQQRDAWGNAATPHAYCVGECLNARSMQLGGLPHYREEPPKPSLYAVEPAAFVGETACCLSSSPPLASTAASAAVAPPLPRQPFATSPLASDAVASAAVSRGSPVRSERADRKWLDGSAVAAGAFMRNPAASTFAHASHGRGITETRPGCTTSTERVRYRNNVTKKLIDLYDEVAELFECRGNMSFQCTQAMRSDPRYTKERHGEVRLAYKPTPQQQAAVTAVSDALETLHDACHELVAVYLTPEEKRYLGIDTHLFQTAAEKKSAYQYAPAAPKSKSKSHQALTSSSQQQQQQQQGGNANTSRSSSASSSGPSQKHHQHRHGGHTAGLPASEARFATQSTSLPSAPSPAPAPVQPTNSTPTPFQEERTATTMCASPSSPPGAFNDNCHGNATQLSMSGDQQHYSLLEASPVVPPSTAAASTLHHDPAQVTRAAPPSGSPLHEQPQPQQAAPPSHEHCPPSEDTTVMGSLGSPERMYAPARSTSSLGGGVWPSDTASATVLAPSAAPRATMPTEMPGVRVTMRGPQGQPLVKVPVQPPPTAAASGGAPKTPAPVSTWPPGIPPGAKLVKVPVGAPLPTAAARTASATAAPTAALPPNHPPSRVNSFTNRRASAAPTAPARRAEFKRLLIDSDSDSTVV